MVLPYMWYLKASFMGCGRIRGGEVRTAVSPLL